MNLFPKDYKQGKVAGTFDDNYVKYSSEGNDGQLSIEQYLKNIISFLSDMIEDLRTSHGWKIHLTMKINFVSTTDLTEKRLMHSESDNAEIVTDLEYYMELCQSIMMTATV